MRILLASASPRRKALLEQIGWEFETVISDVDEKSMEQGCFSHAWELVEALSLKKALAVSQYAEEEDLLVIGADTIVAYNGNILGKPEDEADARRMLSALQGNTHEVYTGVTLIRQKKYPDGRKQVWQSTFHEMTKVFFHPMTEAEIKAYIATGEPMDKAGAYGIQGICAKYIRGIEGDYNNVVGLPVGRLYQEVNKIFIKNK